MNSPMTLIEPIAVSPVGALNYSVSRGGDFVYVPGTNLGQSVRRRSLVWVDRQGKETPLPAEQRSYAVARISPDGTRIALDVRDQSNDIWVWDIARQTMTVSEAAFQLGDLDLQRGRAREARERLEQYLGSFAATPELLLLGVRASRELGDRLAAERYARRLRVDFPDSAQTRALSELTRNPG